MKKSQEILKKEVFGHRSVLIGGMLIVWALFVTGRAVAAPTVNKSRTAARVTATALDPLALRPAWISRTSAVKPPARVMTTVGQRLGIFGVQALGVQVPARPLPRSPFMPPLYPWSVDH